MEEAYALCDELIIMDHGKIIAEGNPEELLDHHFKGATLKFPANHVALTDFPGQLKAHQHGDVIEMHITDTNEAMEALMAAGVDLKRMTIQKPTLEDLFLHLTSAKETPHA
jgi:ABC-2 type transport system ATP-binding protein